MSVKIKNKNNSKPNSAKPNSEKRLLRLNSFISNKKTLTLLILGIFLVGMLLVNYAVNVIYQLPDIMNQISLDDSEKTYTFSLIQAFDFQARFLPFYAALAIMLVILAARLTYQVHQSFADLNIGQKGSEEWSTMEEIKAQYKEIPEKDLRFPGRGGLIVARDGDKLYIDDSVVNNLIIGTTRSGKGETEVIPMIDVYSRAQLQPSLIVGDPKLEAARMSIPTLEARGYDCYILNLIDPEHSMYFNPLTMIIEAYKERRFDTAQLLCSTFCYSIFSPGSADGDSAYWANNSTYLLSAAILALTDDMLKADQEKNEKAKYEYYMKNETYDGFVETHEHEKKINMYSVYNIINSLAKIQYDDGYSALDDYFNDRDEFDPARVIFGSISVAGSTKTKGSIYSNTLSKLTIFTYENIAKMTSKSSIDLMDIGWGKKPIAIFIGIPDYDRSNHFIATAFIKQLYFMLARYATHSPDGKCYREVVFHLDEVGNLPAIDDMANIITVSLGRNIMFNLFIQAYAQLEKLYDKDMATITGNCGNQFYILTNDGNTAKDFSDLIGNKTITNITRSGERFALNKHFTELYEERPLIDKNELMGLQEGECVLKRISKRTDLKGNKIKPTPICNLGERALKYRYQYLQDSFPNNVFLYTTNDTLKVLEKENEARIYEGKSPIKMNEIRFADVDIERTDKTNLAKVSWSSLSYLDQVEVNKTPLAKLLLQPQLLQIAHSLHLNEADQDDLLNEEILAGDILYEIQRQKRYEIINYEKYYELMELINPPMWSYGKEKSSE